jgi:hypothetical protein
MNVLGTLILSESVQKDAGGGLFDFNATLPLMDLQLILLISLLTLLFYQPFDFILKQREVRLTNSLTVSLRRLAQVTELYADYRRNVVNLISSRSRSLRDYVEGSEVNEFSVQLTAFLTSAKSLLNMYGLVLAKPSSRSKAE